ncbi:MAG: hypothetical protein NTZ63_03795 [Candidatus Omnitrophica bacterium]|nr:hypothetical protein [Candidatus Omnitrophota bacterium]
MKYARKMKYVKPYTATDALEIALEKEKTAYKFYDQLLKDAKEFKLVSVVKKLRDSEGVHVKIIQRMLENKKSGAEDIKIDKRIKYATKESYNKPKTFEEALELALVREKSAADFYCHFYRQLFGNSESLYLLVVLKKLSYMEKAHIKIVERMLKNKVF